MCVCNWLECAGGFFWFGFGSEHALGPRVERGVRVCAPNASVRRCLLISPVIPAGPAASLTSSERCPA
ncbi:hypothetical protein KQX54_005631, partial [Cotesia glomerata]